MKAGKQVADGRMAAFAEACRRHGIKATHQRHEIYILAIGVKDRDRLTVGGEEVEL